MFRLCHLYPLSVGAVQMRIDGVRFAVPDMRPFLICNDIDKRAFV